ncbi:putative DEAD/DEAH box helicase [Microdochium trichocladiopsis]|uniref:ATP-dependent RNA helicase n=1 Tax=Microdochium trichocladiopsis TaxID=1682393 RepID=A0A9P8YJ72_9PEZI|nr:putative DEAD/DEAH box helicase [Microdochium trichocladiopsis]KAH7040014.1 putative DEAD/DEAH box helicase [Microdochium trichocladiopsis]
MAPDSKPTKKDPRAWDALTPPLADWILDALSSWGFARATPVQASVINIFGSHKDVVVEAVTGSGKTLAFLIPLIQRILRADGPTKRHHIAVIVVSPTRELATQIHTVLTSLLKFHAASAEILPLLDEEDKRPVTTDPVVVPQLLVGGSHTVQQDISFFLRHSPNFIVATPGRLVELLSSPHVHTPSSTFEALVLDEADRLLDLGFKPDLQKILGHLPKQRRTGLFSASVSEAVGEIIRVGLRNPVKIAVKVKTLKGDVIEERKTPASLKMTYLITQPDHKLPALAQLLEKLDPRPQKSIIFLSTCSAVDYFQHVLPAVLPEGFDLVPLHGRHAAHVREKNTARFMKSTRPTILLTTDVASRGLDFPQVDLVVQLDPPSDPKAFIHRAGRAGRAGRKGLSVIFLHPGREEDYIPFLDVRKTPVVPLEHPEIDLPDSSTPPTSSTITTTSPEQISSLIRATVKTDRALHDKAQKAFVSWLRSYSKHTASSIFRVADLDWTRLGHGWGLLKLPKMPELKRHGFAGDKFLGVNDVDWENYGYANKQREAQRIEAMRLAKDPEHVAAREEKAAQERAKRKRNAEAWSGKHAAEDVRTGRREKKQKRRDAERKENMTEQEKVEEMDLQRLLAQVRAKNAEKAARERAEAKAAAAAGGGRGGGDDAFEGFD